MDWTMPINFKQWVDENRELLKPPVGNKLIWRDRDFIVMVVGGPNIRNDYHYNETEEFFYQIEGDILVKTIDESGAKRDIPIKEGEIFLLPPRIRHSPQRTAGSIGLVIERRRPKGAKDGLSWYCRKCDALLYEDIFELSDIETQLKAAFERYYADPGNYTCEKCGQVNGKL